MQILVALRKESVDRNITNELLTALKTVALRKESVDRNTSRVDANCSLLPSLSARRAWIEIPYVVRLCAGGLMSLSARRAWIEISLRCTVPEKVVSLSARRAWIEMQSCPYVHA